MINYWRGEYFIMVSSIGSDSLTTLLNRLGSKTKSTDDMFKKLSDDVGGDGKTITKKQLEDYISSLESDTSSTADKGKLGFLKQLDSNWDNISNGKDSITSSDLAAGKKYLTPPQKSEKSSDSLFSSLSDAVGASSSGISKDDLVNYLKSLFESSTADSTKSSDSSSKSDTNTTDSSSSTSNNDELKSEMKLITNLIVNFDSFASDNGLITSSSLLSGMKEPQDPLTVTSSQLQSPIDLRV